jgi:polyisoprenoid-binding protein YceI
VRNTTRRVLLLFIATIALSACALLKEPEQASAPIEAVPLQITAAAAGEAQGSAGQAEAYPDPGGASATDAYPAVEQAPAGELRVYTISQADSEVRFQLDEDLRGARNTVVGVTDQVAGEVAVNLDDLSTTQVGLIQINARTLTTDNSFRNRAIQNQILRTGDYEFITFSPTSVEGLPASVAVGETVEFTLNGDLTIRDITKPVQFLVTASAVTADQIAGSASASVSRADYGLQIPSVPNVANVDDVVELSISFVANAG